PSTIQYLSPQTLGPNNTPDASYMPYVLLDPVTQNGTHPASAVAVDDGTGDPTYENPGFVSASNENIFLVYQKEAKLSESSPPPGQHLRALNNQILANILAAGTTYYTRSLGQPVNVDGSIYIEALEKTQNIVEFLGDAGGVVTGPRNPMTSVA